MAHNAFRRNHGRLQSCRSVGAWALPADHRLWRYHGLELKLVIFHPCLELRGAMGGNAFHGYACFVAEAGDTPENICQPIFDFSALLGLQLKFTGLERR